MDKSIFRLGLCLLMVMVFAAVSDAQETPRFTFSGGGGFTGIVGRDTGRLDHGGNVQVNGGFNFNRVLSVTGTFGFNWLGITRSALDALGQPDGNARIYTATLDPVVHLPIAPRFGPYVLFGGGYIKRTVEFTQPTVTSTLIFDPWWGYFGPALIGTNQVLGRVTSEGGVYDVGAGLNVPIQRGRGARVFLELRYFHGFTRNTNTELMPITFGLRW